MGKRRRAASLGEEMGKRRAQISPQQQPSKRPRRKTADAPLPGLSSCTTQIQQAPSPRFERARKRRTPDDVLAADPRAAKPSPFPSWGTKRPRNGVSSSRRRTRDWAYLDDGPVGLIAERVLANDVADYVRFRAVCLPWRRCSADPCGRGVLDDRRFHPRHWIMLLGDRRQDSCRRHFLNTSTGQCIQVGIPELRDHSELQSGGNPEGLLFLLCNTTAAVRLLNPLTRQVAELPPITGLSPNENCCLPNSAGLADDRTVLLYFHCGDGTGRLALAKPGDRSWLLVKTDAPLLMPTMSFRGHFYGVTTEAIMTVDMSSPPRLVVAATLAKPFGRMVDTAHLVDNGGELMLVHRMLRRIPYQANAWKRVYKMYRVNLDAGKTTPVANLRGRAVFIGHLRSLSIAPRVFPSIDANTLYPGLILDERGGKEQIGAYHLRDGTTESFSYDRGRDLVCPWSIADCLAAYVSG